MKENIQLNHVVSPGKFRLLKYGLGYYTWVKSRRNNRHYLLPLKKQEKIIRLAGGIAGTLALSILFGIWFYREQGWLGAVLFGCVADGLTCLFVYRYYRGAVETIDLLPRFPIAVVDLDKGILKIRNRSGLPFVQTPEDTWQIELRNVDSVKINAANKVHNGKQRLWDAWRQVPSWNALSLRCRPSGGGQMTQLLFVGARIPENMYYMFECTLRLKLETKKDFSIFDLD